MQGSRGQREQGEGKVENYLASVGAFLSLGLLIFILTVLECHPIIEISLARER
jgi:hypothetical protein